MYFFVFAKVPLSASVAFILEEMANCSGSLVAKFMEINTVTFFMLETFLTDKVKSFSISY